MSLQDSRKVEGFKVLLKVGADGRGISRIEKVGSSGDIDAYDVVLSDNTRYPFYVTNGSSIESVEKTGSSGLTDIYTITLTNGDEYYFEVTNADGSTASTINYINTSSGLTAENVQDAIDEVVEIKANKTDLTSIVQSGATATQAISSGTYFYLDGVLVRAKTDIASGATFTENTNYEVKTVGDALDEMIKVVDVPYSGFTWSTGSKTFISNSEIQIPSGYELVGFIVLCTNSASILSGRLSNTNKVQVMGWTPSIGTVIDSTVMFNCKMVILKSN